jgi:outer membrane lipoprotein LolB
MHAFYQRFCYGFIIFSAVILTGCTHLQTSPESQISYKRLSWQQRQQALKHIADWDINGAFSIRQPNQTTIASFEWTQKEKNYRIRINSSLDLYGVNIVGRPGLVMLWRAQNEHFSARSPEQLMQQQLGWRLPVSNLYYWMRGLPAPGNYQAQFDNFGHIVMLTQQGWQIHYEQYLSVGTVDLPQILDLTNQELGVKIVIKHWKF